MNRACELERKCSTEKNNHMNKKNQQKQKRDDTAAIVAEMQGVSAAYVRMIINGKRNNKAILKTYKQLQEGKKQLIETVRNQLPYPDQYT
jgi:hypothetical protein